MAVVTPERGPAESAAAADRGRIRVIRCVMSPRRPMLLSAVFGSKNWRRHGFIMPLRVGQASEALFKYPLVLLSLRVT